MKSISFFVNIKNRISNTWTKYLYLKNVVGKYITYRETLPVKANQILFSSQRGLGVLGNMYYLVEEAVGREGYNIYVASSTPDRDRLLFAENNIVANVVLIDSPEFLYALATSKYLATDARLESYFIKRDEQILLNTWHGAPLRRIGIGVNYNIKGLGYMLPQFIACDYIIFSNEYEMDVMRQAYLLDSSYCKKGLLTGYPRNAAFFRNYDREALKRKLGINNKKVYFYMPTWRGQNKNDREKTQVTQTEEILRQLDDELNDDIVIIYKHHRFISLDQKEKLGYKHIQLFPDDIETYVLLSLADVLITDYSSVFFDFACTGREIILFTYDLDDYLKYNSFYITWDELPFTRLNTTEELIRHINNSKPFEIDDRYREFQNKHCAYSSAMAPTYVNDVFLDGKPLAHGQMVNYPGNIEKAYNVYLISTFPSEEKMTQMLQTVFADPNALLMISDSGFRNHGASLYDPIIEKGIPFIPVKMRITATITERILLKLYRNTGLFKKTARKVILREKERIIPRLQIASLINLSDNQLFKDIITFVSAGTNPCAQD